MSTDQPGLSDDSQAWCTSFADAAATANTVETRVRLLKRLEPLDKPALVTLLKGDSSWQDGISVLLQWWPSLSRVEDPLLMLKVIHNIPLSAKDLLETSLPEFVDSVVNSAPKQTTFKAMQLSTTWKRILSAAQRCCV